MSIAMKCVVAPLAEAAAIASAQVTLTAIHPVVALVAAVRPPAERSAQPLALIALILMSTGVIQKIDPFAAVVLAAVPTLRHRQDLEELALLKMSRVAAELSQSDRPLTTLTTSQSTTPAMIRIAHVIMINDGQR
jgi:hypothetical protein